MKRERKRKREREGRKKEVGGQGENRQEERR